MSELKNYYEVLEVPSSAKQEDIYQSYQRAKLAYSTDSLALYSLMSAEECRNILELVEEAYSILSDPAKRKRYDEVRGLNRDFGMNSSHQFVDRFESPVTSYENNANNNSKIEMSHLFNNDFKINTNRDSEPLSTNVNASSPSMSSNGISTNVTKLVTQKKFALDYVANTDFEREIEETLDFTGELLRKIREYKNVDLDRLADMTKVSRMHLQNIENEDFSKLPAAVYVRGFVFQYAKCLKLKPDAVANSYLNRMKKAK